LTHEMTIAREIAEHVTRAAQKAEAKSVVAVELELGDLAFFDTAALEMWLHQAFENGIAKDAAISIDVVESTLTCKDCGHRGQLEVPAYHDHHLPLPPAECPHCGSANVALDARTDCILKRIELEV